MPQHTYDVVIDGSTYTVSSDQPLTDVQAYTYAKSQAGQGAPAAPQPQPQNWLARTLSPERFAELSQVGEAIQNPTPDPPPETGVTGFIRGLMGNRSHASNLDELMSGQTLGMAAHDLAPIAIGMGLGKAGDAVGRGLEVVGKSPITEAAARHVPYVGPYAAKVVPPTIRGVGRLLQSDTMAPGVLHDEAMHHPKTPYRPTESGPVSSLSESMVGDEPPQSSVVRGDEMFHGQQYQPTGAPIAPEPEVPAPDPLPQPSILKGADQFRQSQTSGVVPRPRGDFVDESPVRSFAEPAKPPEPDLESPLETVARRQAEPSRSTTDEPASLKDILAQRETGATEPEPFAWKKGDALTPEVMQQGRDALGSDAAAKLFGVSKQQLKANTVANGLSITARRSVDARLAKMTRPEEVQAYHDAGNTVAQDYIRRTPVWKKFFPGE